LANVTVKTGDKAGRIKKGRSLWQNNARLKVRTNKLQAV